LEFNLEQAKHVLNLDKKRALVSIPDAFRDIEGYKDSEIDMLRVLNINTSELGQLCEKRFRSLFDSVLGCLTAFKISNTVQFYRETLKSVVGSESSLGQIVERESIN
jgi:hypothetical protein